MHTCTCVHVSLHKFLASAICTRGNQIYIYGNSKVWPIEKKKIHVEGVTFTVVHLYYERKPLGPHKVI